jgi:hypothetical protein
MWLKGCSRETKEKQDTTITKCFSLKLSSVMKKNTWKEWLISFKSLGKRRIKGCKSENWMNHGNFLRMFFFSCKYFIAVSFLPFPIFFFYNFFSFCDLQPFQLSLPFYFYAPISLLLLNPLGHLVTSVSLIVKWFFPIHAWISDEWVGGCKFHDSICEFSFSSNDLKIK